MKKEPKTRCEHKDENCVSLWKYQGKEIVHASGYCEACGKKFIWDEKSKRLVEVG